MTGDTKRNQKRNESDILASQKKRQDAGKVASGPGTATASRADRGLKRRSE